jgi:putative (di)nucleoside polyphosphate hydrolase
MLLNAKNMVFIGKRIDTTSDAWQMPQGGIDEGEEASAAALRELEEEAGTRNATILAQSREWLSYDLPDRLIPRIWNGKYRGQRQKWFALRFLGEDSQININTAHPEFCEWRWATITDLPDLAAPFKRLIYNKVIEEFLPVIK